MRSFLPFISCTFFHLLLRYLAIKGKSDLYPVSDLSRLAKVDSAYEHIRQKGNTISFSFLLSLFSCIRLSVDCDDCGIFSDSYSYCGSWKRN